MALHALTRPNPDETSRAVARGIGVAGAALVGAVLATMRHQGPSVLDSMWAEDGTVFVQQAFETDPVTALFQPFAGYLHVPSRIMATIARLLPIENAAAVMSGGAALVVGVVAVFVYFASAGVIASRGLRALLACSVVLTPVARIESLNNVSNLHFYFVFAAFWALLWIPRHTAGVVASSVIVAAAALSDPLVVLLVPLAVLRWAITDDLVGRAPVIVGAVALGIQGAAVVLGGFDTAIGTPADPDPVSIAALYPLRVVGGAVLGLQLSWGLWGSIGILLLVLTAAALVAGVAYTVTRPDLERRSTILVCLGLSVAYLIVGLWIRWDPSFAPGADDRFLRVGVRYVLLPVLFLMAAVAMVLDRADPRVSTGAWRAATVLAIGLIVTTWLVDFSGPNARSRTPSWAESVAAAGAACAVGDAVSTALPIAPVGWSMTLPCDALPDTVPPDR